MESPPKRLTRARAAARGATCAESTVKSAKIVTAAARARTADSTTASRSTLAKRKTRSDEVDDDVDELEEATDIAKKPVRGRPRKVTEADSQPVPLKPSTRGRPAKKAATASTRDEPEQVKAVRGRPRKKAEEGVEASSNDMNSTSHNTTTTARGRAAAAKPVTKSSQTKKAVKFQEPDKENDGPTTAKGPSSLAGMRARPARRALSTAAQSVKTGTKGQSSSSAKPLSPKKVTQIPIPRMDSSEDELAGSDTPVKRMQKKPIKPPSDLPVSPRKPEIRPPDDDNTATINDAILNPPTLETNSLGSPARRPPASPFKGSMKSPARKIGSTQLTASMIKPRNATGERDIVSPSKSLFQSAAKRPQSPIKGLLFASTNQPNNFSSPSKSSVLRSPAKRAVPGYKSHLASPSKPHRLMIEETPRMKTIISGSTTSSSCRPSEKLLDSCAPAEEEEDDVFIGPVGSLRFPGRMSAVLPRDTDPTEPTSIGDTVEAGDMGYTQLNQIDHTCQAAAPEELIDGGQGSGEGLNEPDTNTSSDIADTVKSAHQLAMQTPSNPSYQLRAKDLNPCHDTYWESEDDLSPTKSMETTGVSSLPNSSKSRRATIGLSSLAAQLGSWSPADPIVPQLEQSPNIILDCSDHFEAHLDGTNDEAKDSLAAPSDSFFEQELSARVSLAGKDFSGLGPLDNSILGEPILEDVIITDEDVELAQEANEMSLQEAGQCAKACDESFSDAVSEASQEYADENQVPIDPELAAAPTTRAPTTPSRPAPNIFNTTTKVPLKPADYSTPSPLKKRSLSASRVALRRPSGSFRSGIVIPYQPAEVSTAATADRNATDTFPNTPAKSDIWSSIGTPARTPRRDIDPDLLRGAVVFVDVHTSEGADASGIFVDLLNQMGARCVKTWNWSSDSEGPASKCAITHVVFKDGGKRTMERVRQANGVVHCVGVTWVLDCERENEWLDESPYYVDRSFVPRGGARRRKSMEPKTLANLNGTLVNNTGRKPGSSRDRRSMPKTPMNRRQSTVWVHTPSDHGEDGEDAEGGDDYDWSQFLVLTPIPKTPAPEALAQYAASTPSNASAASSPTQEDLLMHTCPPKSAKFSDFETAVVESCLPKSSTYEDLGVGSLRKDKDEHMRVRLMAAKRKSLQFAPKIGSPLARTWQ